MNWRRAGGKGSWGGRSRAVVHDYIPVGIQGGPIAFVGFVDEGTRPSRDPNGDEHCRDSAIVNEAMEQISEHP